MRGSVGPQHQLGLTPVLGAIVISVRPDGQREDFSHRGADAVFDPLRAQDRCSSVECHGEVLYGSDILHVALQGVLPTLQRRPGVVHEADGDGVRRFCGNRSADEPHRRLGASPSVAELTVD